MSLHHLPRSGFKAHIANCKDKVLFPVVASDQLTEVLDPVTERKRTVPASLQLKQSFDSQKRKPELKKT